MSRSMFLALIMALAYVYTNSFAEPTAQKTIFVKGSGGYNIYRIPALLTTQKGALLAFSGR